MKRFVEGWNEFWFDSISPLPVCVYRIVHGVLMLLMQAMMLPQLLDLFGEKAIMSYQTARGYTNYILFDLFQWVPVTNTAVYVLFGLWMLVTLGFTLGFKTRLMTFLALVGIATFHCRTGLIWHSGDTILRIMLVYLLFAPAGAMLSLDRKLSRRTDEPTMEAWPLRLMQIQFCVIYITTVMWKSTGQTWINGTAIYYATRIEEFWQLGVPYVLDHLWTIKLMTWGTLAVELALGTLIWLRELRYPVLILGLLLHLGIEWTMNIPLFEWTMMGLYVLWLEPHTIQRLANRRARPVA